MPRTRNISRRQWDAANAELNSRSKENGYDSEKENVGRVTRSRSGARPVLGSSSTRRTATTNAKAKAKGKGKSSSKGTKTKTEKLPLQDITERFLPAPESANRGHPRREGFGRVEAAPTHASPPRLSLAQPRHTGARHSTPILHSRIATFPSSLPPSSPPSASSITHEVPAASGLPRLSRSPVHDVINRRLFERTELVENRPRYDAWDEFDFVARESEDGSGRGPTPRNSDPFGFFALERKLKTERELEDEEADDLIPLADTSSPRPVRRLPLARRVEPQLEKQAEQQEEDLPNIPPTPPTPHKMKGKARWSCGSEQELHIFSPHPSSCPSSPSPSKPRTSSVKRKAPAVAHWVEHEEEEEANTSFKIPGKKQAKVVLGDEVQPIGRQLRSSRRPQRQENSGLADAADREEGRSVKRRTSTSKKPRSATTKGKSKSKKSAPKTGDDSDAEQKWEDERQRRLEYFRQLEEYEVETEEVYVI